MKTRSENLRHLRDNTPNIEWASWVIPKEDLPRFAIVEALYEDRKFTLFQTLEEAQEHYAHSKSYDWHPFAGMDLEAGEELVVNRSVKIAPKTVDPSGLSL